MIFNLHKKYQKVIFNIRQKLLKSDFLTYTKNYSKVFFKPTQKILEKDFFNQRKKITKK